MDDMETEAIRDEIVEQDEQRIKETHEAESIRKRSLKEVKDKLLRKKEKRESALWDADD